MDKVPVEYVLFLSQGNVPKAMTTVEIPEATAEDNTCSQIVRALKSDHSTSYALWNSPVLKAFQYVQAELSVTPGGLTLCNTKLVILATLRALLWSWLTRVIWEWSRLNSSFVHACCFLGWTNWLKSMLEIALHARQHC